MTLHVAVKLDFINKAIYPHSIYSFILSTWSFYA